jgi:hypothetical protein
MTTLTGSLAIKILHILFIIDNSICNVSSHQQKLSESFCPGSDARERGIED